MKVRSLKALRQLRKWRTYVLVVIWAYGVALGLGALLAPLRGNLENLVFDQYQRWKPRPYDFDQPVRIVDIDDEFIDLHSAAGPGRGRRWRRLVEALRQSKGRRHRFRLPVLGDGPGRPRRSSRLSAPGAGHGGGKACEGQGGGDPAFAQALQGQLVVLGEFLTPTHNGSQASLTTKAGFSFVGDPPTEFVTHFNGVLGPIPELANAALGMGFLNWLPDNDRVVRRVPLLLDSNT